jgi:hypothetical protein
VFVNDEDICCVGLSALENNGAGVGEGEEEPFELLVANLVLKEGSKVCDVMEVRIGNTLPPFTRYIEHAANVAAYAAYTVVPLQSVSRHGWAILYIAAAPVPQAHPRSVETQPAAE